MALTTTAKKAWSRYCDLLVTRPLITKGLTGGTLFSTGDLLAQYLDGTLQTTGYNPKRTAIGFCWSSCIFTPHGHTWFAKILPHYFPTNSMKHTISKMLIDQTFFATYVNSLYLTYSTTAHLGYFDLDIVKNKLNNELFNVLKANWMLWPIVQVFTFRFIPIPLQMPFMNVVVLFWSCYLATVSAKTIKEQQSHGDKIAHPPYPEDIVDVVGHVATVPHDIKRLD